MQVAAIVLYFVSPLHIHDPSLHSFSVPVPSGRFRAGHDLYDHTHNIMQNIFSLILNNLPLLSVILYYRLGPDVAADKFHSISSILLSRFLLDLREHHLYPNRGVTHDSISMTSMHFGSSREDAFSSTSDETSRGWASNVVRDFDDPDEIIFSSDENVCNTFWSDETDLT